ncbi:LacI family DNA-binding transcriptional regulator, partial [Alteromonas sp. 14N.309.X.WAT.G.H12]|uniref:LacI family DNA-binding transcriptional regulator n=1 Tax=Alteromonas sp. 14N.309.X.WAT.G.H12 TaxID=3120824 RepID=UPI002FCFECAD
MTTSKLTIKEVASRLNVSTATISNAFNRPDQLSAKKREAILKACEEMGYMGPNKAARSLRRGKSNIVALILPDSLDYMVSDPVASQFIRGVTQVLKNTPANLLLFSGNNDSVNDIVDFVDGFICYGA